MAARADHFVELLADASEGNGGSVQWPGGLLFFQAHATSFNSGNVIIQSQMKQGDWVPVTNASLGADGAVSVYVGAGRIRAVAPAGSSGVYASATLIPVA